jgi:transketolase N-terminal domain/subunit
LGSMQKSPDQRPGIEVADGGNGQDLSLTEGMR